MIHPLLAAAAIVTTIAGVPGTAGHFDGPAMVATFNKPTQITLDDENGDIYVTDRINLAVRKIGGGSVSTYVSYANVPPATFDFGGPVNGGIVVEPPGKYPTGPFFGRGLFIASSGDHVVEQRDIYGAIFDHDVAFVGVRDTPGFYNGPIGPTLSTPTFNTPTAMAIDRRRYPTQCCAARTIYIADTGNGSIRKLTREINIQAEYRAVRIDTVASGFAAPRGLAFAPDGALYVSDAAAGTVSRVAGGTVTVVAAGLNAPTGIDVDAGGNVYVAETGNHVIRRLLPDGAVETVAGEPGEAGHQDGTLARFNGPVGIQVTPDGSLIVADTSNHVIRKISFVASPPQPRRRGVRH